jgi:hypothetical protein
VRSVLLKPCHFCWRIAFIPEVFFKIWFTPVILCFGIFPEWLQTESPVSFSPAPTPFEKINIKIVQVGHGLEVSLDAEHKHLFAKGEIRCPGYQRRHINDWKETCLCKIG